MKRFSKLRFVLWWLGLLGGCPVCGSELILHGYKSDWTCSRLECRFNKRR